MVKEVMLGVRVEREVYEALKIMARARRVKTSVIVREALSMYLAAAFFFAYPRLAGVFSEAKPTAVRTSPSSQQRVPTAVETTPIGTPAENAAPAPAPQAAVLTAVETPPEAPQPAQPAAAPTAVGSKEGERRRKVTLRAALQPPPRPTPQDIARWERERLEKGLLRARLAEEKRRELLKRKLQL